MRRILKFFIFIAVFFALERLCHQATDGFALVNVYAPKGENGKWKRDEKTPENLLVSCPKNSLKKLRRDFLDLQRAEIDGSLEKLPRSSPQQSRKRSVNLSKNFWDKTLDQTFTYFDSGSQSYVFLSEDGKTIVKLFKFQHMRTPPLFDIIPSVGKLKDKREKKRAVLERTFDSLTLAYDTMREETGLLYLHLTKTDHLKKTITIVDKIGRKHSLDLDDVEFLLQKRGILAYDTIDKWMAEGKKKEAEKGIRSLLQLAVSRCHKGIFDKDPDFSTNFGFVDQVPFQIDFGRLSLSEEEKDPAIYGPEMIRITREFERWIAKNHPTLLDSFQEELDAITHP